jgi:hypothetical protein
VSILGSSHERLMPACTSLPRSDPRPVGSLRHGPMEGATGPHLGSDRQAECSLWVDGLSYGE